MQSDIYTTLKCDLGFGNKTYLFNGMKKAWRVEAREVDDKGNLIAVGGDIAVPMEEFKKLLRDSKPYQSTHIY